MEEKLGSEELLFRLRSRKQIIRTLINGSKQVMEAVFWTTRFYQSIGISLIVLYKRYVGCLCACLLSGFDAMIW